MRCVNCGKTIGEFDSSLIISVDGDGVCNDSCHDKYLAKRDKFFNETVHDDTKFDNWIKGED